MQFFIAKRGGKPRVNILETESGHFFFCALEVVVRSTELDSFLMEAEDHQDRMCPRKNETNHGQTSTQTSRPGKRLLLTHGILGYSHRKDVQVL